jgi:hypothetical protein
VRRAAPLTRSVLDIRRLRKDRLPMIEVVSGSVVGPYILDVTFRGGERRQIDIESELWGPMFEPLREVEFFAKAHVDPESGTVAWPNGADLAPEFLYDRGQPVVCSEPISERVR